MKSIVVGSLKFHNPQMGFHENLQKSLLQPLMAPCGSSSGSGRRASIITCGLRGGPRKPLWRSRVLSTEAIQAVQSLKLAKSSPKLEEVFNYRISRLLKADVLDTLAELQRQNELDLALKVFNFVREEVWYKPDLSLYSELIRLLGKNKLVGMAEAFFAELKKEGLEPNTRTYTEMIGVYIQMDMIEKAMEMYGQMKASGCTPEKLTLTILIRNLEKAGEEELAATIKKEVVEYVDSPKKFLQEVETKFPKRRSVNLI